MADPPRALVMADEPLPRAGVAALCAAAGAIVVAQSEVDPDAAASISSDSIDVVIVGAVRGEDLDPDVLEAIGEGGPALVVLAATGDQAATAWSAGASAVLRSAATARELAAAIAAVCTGLRVSDPSLSQAHDPSAAGARRMATDEELTPRETEVLQLLAEGLPNKSIARRLGITEHTVKFHVNGVLAKLGASSRTEAAVRAARMGLVPL